MLCHGLFIQLAEVQGLHRRSGPEALSSTSARSAASIGKVEIVDLLCSEHAASFAGEGVEADR